MRSASRPQPGRALGAPSSGAGPVALQSCPCASARRDRDAQSRLQRCVRPSSCHHRESVRVLLLVAPRIRALWSAVHNARYFAATGNLYRPAERPSSLSDLEPSENELAHFG